MKKLLLTGYSGFIGSSLLDDLYTNYDYDLKLLGRKKPDIDCQFLKASIESDTDFSEILKDVEIVIHAAARVHIMRDNSNDPLEDYREVNLRGTLNLAQQAAKSGVKRFIFLSSIKVNGEKTSLEKPFTNEDKHEPMDAYGLSKSEAEHHLKMLSVQTGMEYVIVRPPLVYGKNVKGNFASLIKLTSKKIPLPFGALNTNRRSLVSVYNLIDLIKNCIENPNAANKTFLVSDGDDLSTTELVELMSEIQSVKPILISLPVWFMELLGKLIGKQDIISRLTDSLLVDIKYTQETLDWTPPFSVIEGFSKCIEKKNV